MFMSRYSRIHGFFNSPRYAFIALLIQYYDYDQKHTMNTANCHLQLVSHTFPIFRRPIYNQNRLPNLILAMSCEAELFVPPGRSIVPRLDSPMFVVEPTLPASCIPLPCLILWDMVWLVVQRGRPALGYRIALRTKSFAEQRAVVSLVTPALQVTAYQQLLLPRPQRLLMRSSRLRQVSMLRLFLRRPYRRPCLLPPLPPLPFLLVLQGLLALQARLVRISEVMA